MMSKDAPLNRRRFFRQGLNELLKPIARAVAPMERAVRQLSELERSSPPAPSPSAPDAVSKPRQPDSSQSQTAQQTPTPAPQPQPASSTVPRRKSP